MFIGMIVHVDVFMTSVAALMSVISAMIVLVIYFRSKRQFRVEFLENSFDLLLRLNEKALESDKNLAAVLKSINRADETGIEEARILYFHYMRINRTYRAYEFNREKFISDGMRDRISAPYFGSYKYLLDTKDGDEKNSKLSRILALGYPSDFREWFITEVKNSEELPLISN